MSSEVVRPGRESFKRFIKTIMEQLPDHIAEYPPSDQLLLTEFLSVLQYYEEADYQRNKLSKRFEEYNNRILGTDQYLQTAFLWFTYNYFSNAYLLLNVSKFHANRFYEYIAKHLRGSSSTPGVYGLIRENIPLSNLAWEQLQYESNKLLYPLSEHQFQILITLYSFIKEGGIDALNQRKIRTAIISQVPFPHNVKPTTELSRFFRLIDGRWFLRFHSPAFGLDRLFFHFELNVGNSLKDIIDFHNRDYTVLGLSAVYYVRDHPNAYIGTLVVPTNTINQLKAYLYHRETEGDINVIDLTKIYTIHRNVSFENYIVGTGWSQLSQKEMTRLTSQIKVKHPRKKFQPYSLSFTTPSYNPNWDFKEHPLPTQIIRLYCKFSKEFSISSLPIQTACTQNTFTLSRSEIGLLRQLHYNQVVHIGFVPYRLIYEFSLDSYWIKLPRIPKLQLKTFLNTIPYCEYYITDSSIQIWTRLNSQLIQWIKDELKWKLYPILPTHPPHGMEFEWFDQNNLMWIQPNLF